MNPLSHNRNGRILASCAALLTALFAVFALAPNGRQALFAAPSSVTLAGSFQEELGCPGDWDPACAATHLSDMGNSIWRGQFNVPAGAHEYKMVLDDSWDNPNYPAANKMLNLGAATDIRFYYDDKTHGVIDSVNDSVAVAAGSFQSEIGCSGDWQPECVRSLLTDVDDDGTYTFATSGLPVGFYEFKVALDEMWTTSYPASNASFTTTATDEVVTISWNSATNAVDVNVATAGPDYTVAVVGDLQDELGCPGDWQPECPNTEMSYDAADDVWQATFAVSGSHEYKVALNDSWDVNYGAGAQQGGANIPLTAAGDVKFYYDDKSHWITDNVNSVIATAAGSFQSELGCPGDWQPDCLRSWLQDIDGDGVYQFTTIALPAGDYETKVTLNESWDVSYGVGGGNDNIFFTVPADNTSVTILFDSATNIPTVTVGTGPSTEPGDEDLVLTPVSYAAQEDVFYFVLPDRFSDGDPTNNEGSGGTLAETGYKVNDKAFYHGGDFAGLQSKLPYLSDLGVSAIWITPPFENLPTQPDGSTAEGFGAAYHGYWILDFENADPHLGTNQELIDLVDAAHAQGIKVFFDIVVNHTADVIQYAEGTDAYISKTAEPYRDANGNEFDDSDYAGDPSFPPLDAATSFPYTPVFGDPADATAKNPAFLNDLTLYHNRGNSTFSGENSQYGDFFGLDDTFTEHPTVVNGFIDIFKNAIDVYDIDGFRIDTVKHVNTELWQVLGPEVMDYAHAQGKTDFYMFGEVFDGNPAFMSIYTTEGSLPSVLDFGMQGQASGFAVYGNNTNQLRDFFALDDYYTDADSNAYGLANFISNHDIGRIGKTIQDVTGAVSDSEMVARSELAHGLLYFSRGFPVVYYGDEQGFTGDGGDKDAREDMMPSQVAVYNDNNLIGTTATTADDNFDESHVIYQTLAEYAGVRAANPALSYGTQIHRYSEGTAGIYAFSRIDRDEQIEYLVVLNNSTSADSATFATYSPGTLFTEIYPGDGSGFTSAANGNVIVDVPALSVTIYKAETAIPASNSAIPLSFNTPAAGSELLGRVEAGVTLGTSQLAEVTFAVSLDGGVYESIGVDTNAPYRIFYDTSTLAAGTEVTFKAIASDLNGHLSSTKITVTVGEEAPPPDSSAPYAIIHYARSDDDYGDHTTGNSNDFWGLHLWGDAIAPSEGTDWPNPKPFLGEDEYGRFAWIALQDATQNVNFIVHRGDIKDGTTADRSFNPAAEGPEIWLKQDDGDFYTSQAEAQGYVTIHYRRPAGDYGIGTADYWGLHLWGDAIAPGEGTSWDAPKPPDGVDDFGAYYNIAIVDANQPVNFIVHTPSGDSVPATREPGGDRSFLPTDDASIFLMQGDEAVYPSQGAAQDFATIHYHRADGDYGDYTSSDFNDFWGMHVWDGAASPNPAWQQPIHPAGFDIYGPYFEIDLVDNAPQLAYIIHRGDTKDPGVDQFLNLAKWGYEVWQLEGVGPFPDDPHYVLPVLAEAGANPGNLNEQRAHWVDEQTIAWAAADDGSLTYYLAYAPDGGLTATTTGVEGGTLIELEQGTLSADVQAKFPHLAGLPALQIPAASLELVPEILKGQIALAAVDADGNAAGATGIQIPGVLDDLYTYNGDLGVTWDGNGDPTIRVWAPTAKSVTFHLFADSDLATTSTTTPMTLDLATGVWSIEGDASWKGQYYLYEVEVYVNSTQQVERNLVTDPYSLSLSMNSTRSQIVDLRDAALKPAGWGNVEKPALVAPEDITIYELHVRDFSIYDQTVAPEDRGTYKAFTYENSSGMMHLQTLADAGLSHLHLLPVFDIATINEDRSSQTNPDPAVLATYASDSDQQQAAVTAVADLDGFNWGYDPFHYTTPEGSYSTNPDGSTRIVEFREMVQAVNETGLRVVMDVVYNHTSASGQNDKSVLDKIVPGYYHRLNDVGAVETSTCCQNTASEHAMFEKLMIDSLVTWAVQYKVDAFRFDLMGHHMVSNMLNIRAALDELTLAEDGVDGSAIYLYGEGWNFGEVANNARGVNATQLNLAGTGIGTFSDRLRDAVRGGGPFDGGQDLIRRQGFANGLYYDPNALNSGSQSELNTLLLLTDQIRVGMAGNLASYQFVDRNGNLVTGAQVDYNGQPAGYTVDPQENISYISKHDNQTLYDNNVYKLPVGTSMADRVRAQTIGLSTVMYGQGVPFFHAGVDLLRSKSLDRDSYNSGDWFNQLDFTYQSNNFGVGLPVQGVNGDNWSIMQPLLANPALQPDMSAIQQMNAMFAEMLAIRNSSALFHLATAAEVQARQVYYNTGPSQLPGLIVMSISDKVGADIDPLHEQVVVLINANDQVQTFTSAAFAGTELYLHPVLANSVDSVVKTSTYDSATGTFTVPGRTAVVFVEYATPTELVDNLYGDVQALVASGALQANKANRLYEKLNEVKATIAAGEIHAAINQLDNFIKLVEQSVSKGDLTAADGEALIAKAELIISLLQ